MFSTWIIKELRNSIYNQNFTTIVVIIIDVRGEEVNKGEK
jgi:hypothetical protein